MANKNLKDQRISTSYQRLVQLDPDTSTIIDGSGSYISLDVNGEVSASNGISGSGIHIKGTTTGSIGYVGGEVSGSSMNVDGISQMSSSLEELLRVLTKQGIISSSFI